MVDPPWSLDLSTAPADTGGPLLGPVEAFWDFSSAITLAALDFEPGANRRADSFSIAVPFLAIDFEFGGTENVCPP